MIRSLPRVLVLGAVSLALVLSCADVSFAGSGGEGGCAQPDHFLVGIDIGTGLRRIDAREHAGVGAGGERDGESARCPALGGRHAVGHDDQSAQGLSPEGKSGDRDAVKKSNKALG